MNKFRLIPYKVEQIMHDPMEIPYGVNMIKAPEIWNESEKGKGVVIALFITGCQVNHPDLKGRIIGGKNFSNDGKPDDISDLNGHGTYIAGIIGANENGNGIVGVAPEANLLILKVFDADNIIHIQNLIDAMDYAMAWRGPNEERVRIFALPIGSSISDSNLHEAIKRAVQKDILVVSAVGNDGDANEQTNEVSYPAAYPEVVSVGAVGPDKKIASFSNSNAEIDLVVPGVNILSTYLDNQYVTMSGTASTVPHVAGAAALIIRQYEKLTGRTLSEPELYAELIKRTVSLGYDKRLEGNGLLVLTEKESNT